MSTLTEAAAGPATTPVAVELTYREADQRRARGRDGEPTRRSCCMGEDVDADGGVFKTNIGLLEKFGAGARPATRRSARTASWASPWA